MIKTNRQVEGFAMIEVLLAVVILAIGLLAGSRMQILGLNYTQGATSRSYATMAANDILDRMRLNPSATATYGGFNSNSTIPPDQGCATNGCNPVQLANHDLRIWARYFRAGDATQAATLLPPGAFGTITDQGNGVMNVTITWDDFIRGSASQQTVSIGAVI